MSERLKYLVWLLAAVALALGVWQLERERATVSETRFFTDAGPVSLYQAHPEKAAPLVVVAHGFAGSRQMMQYISRDLARAGYTVAAFDFHGHGRSTEKLSPDVTRIEGTTQQLVEQTRAVKRAVQQEVGQGAVDPAAPIAMLGHSMATDIVIRAAEDLPDVAAIVAISMYSEAITPTFPKRLLVLSGEWEGRLRAAGLDAVAQLGGAVEEGIIITNGDVVRRTVSVDRTEHVAVLFVDQTMQETRDWLKASIPTAQSGVAMPRGGFILAVLVAMVVLIWPLARLLPKAARDAGPVPRRLFFMAALLPAPFAMAVASWGSLPLFQTAGFGSLALFFFVWGSVALAVLWLGGRRPGPLSGIGLVVFLAWALGFAWALDRYAAAFLPLGPRLPVFAVFAAAALPFALADRMLVEHAALWQRALTRALPVLALMSSMILAPTSLGLSFSVLPVLVLYFAVFGTMARAIARRSGPLSAGLGQAVLLGWSIAASTPLFMPAV